MWEYLYKIKTIYDLLEVVGHNVSDFEQILTILNGLSNEYKAMVAVIASHKILPSVDDVHSILQAYEARIENKRTQELDFFINYTSNIKNKNQNNISDQSSQRAGPANRARGRGRYNNSNIPKCQICERIGHTTVKCYFIYSNQNTNTNNNQRSGNYSVNVAQASSSNQTDNKDHNSSENSQPESAQDVCWYPNSGDTNHITNNLDNLNLGNKEYRGKQSICMGNVKCIKFLM